MHPRSVFAVRFAATQQPVTASANPVTTSSPQQSSPGLQPVTASANPATSSSAKPSAHGLKPTTTLLRPITAAPKDIAGLVAWLGHENAWQRETAQRLLVERAASADIAFWRALDSLPMTEMRALHAQMLL